MLITPFKITTFKINGKTLSRRCEICHQQDQFDANQEICQRCQPFAIERASSNKQISHKYQPIAIRAKSLLYYKANKDEALPAIVSKLIANRKQIQKQWLINKIKLLIVVAIIILLHYLILFSWQIYLLLILSLPASYLIFCLSISINASCPNCMNFVPLLRYFARNCPYCDTVLK